MARSSRPAPDRVFVQDGRRHFRRRYSGTEVLLGLGVLAVLAALLGWVAWRGANPDPSLFGSDADLLTGSGAPADRGPIPEGLVLEGWVEGPVSTFGFDNLYEKINGREGYYKSFGFEQLTFVSLADSEDPTRAIDIEVFDLGKPANAMGAYAGERPAEIVPASHAAGLSHLDRNAMYLTRGPLYVRALGSEESAAVTAQLEAIREAFLAAAPAAEPETAGGEPDAVALFGRLGIEAFRVEYVAENAFSFGFAKEVYSVLLEDGETELFLVDAGPEEAAALAARFREGFLEYGNPAEAGGSIAWVEDRYLATLAGARAEGGWVLGVRGAPDLETAERALADLGRALSGEE
jgi:hypothetical protein